MPTMPRRKNRFPSAPLRISTTPQVERYLDELIDTGLFGKTRAEVAERLISNGMKDLIREGIIKKLRR